MAADEVRQGDFVYRDTLFVDLGSGKRHTRASATELKDLLLPKRGQVSPKDPVAHWYEAQLLHYGLPRTKDKNAAKVRLTSAIAAGNLTVPAYIARMETDMKKEFAASNRKAKANETGSKSKKRKAESADDDQAAASRTKISVTVGNVMFDIDHEEDTVHSSRKQKVAKKTPSPAEKKSATTPKRSANSVTPTKSPKRSATASVDQSPAKARQTAPRFIGTASVNRPLKKQTARKDNGPAAVLNQSRSNLPPTYHGHTPFNTHNQYDEDDLDKDDAPPPYDSLGFSYKHNDNENRGRTVRLQASGTYAVSTMFDGMDCELTLAKDTQTSQFWAHFLAADHRGVLHIPNTNGMATQQFVKFNWRAEELGSGRLRFKRDQDGWIQFDGEGGVRGCWNGLLNGDDLEFEGGLEGEPNFEAEELIDQWDWFVRSAYGR